MLLTQNARFYENIGCSSSTKSPYECSYLITLFHYSDLSIKLPNPNVIMSEQNRMIHSSPVGLKCLWWGHQERDWETNMLASLQGPCGTVFQGQNIVTFSLRWIKCGSPIKLHVSRDLEFRQRAKGVKIKTFYM